MLTANPAGRFHALKRFLISAYSHNSGLLLGPSAFLTEAQRPSWVWWKNTQALSKYLLMIPSTVNNHPQPKGRPALYFSTTKGLESFLPMLWEKDGLSCSFLECQSYKTLHPSCPALPWTPKMHILTSGSVYPPLFKEALSSFLTLPSDQRIFDKVLFQSLSYISLAWHGEEEKCIIKQSDATSFALLAINGAFRQASEAQVQAVSGCSYLRSAIIPPTMQRFRCLRANRKWHLQIGTSSFCTLFGC